MKIILLTQYPTGLIINGGVESSMFGLVDELEKFKDLELHIVTCTKLVNSDKIISGKNVFFHFLHSPNLPNLITSLTIDQKKIKSITKKLKPDVIHAHMSAPVYGYPVLKLDYPTITTIHGIINEESRTWSGSKKYINRLIYNRMEKQVFKEAKMIVAVTPYVSEKIRKIAPRYVEIIPNGIQDLFFEIKNNEVPGRLLFVGGIEPRKGLHNLIKAIHIIKEEIQWISLHIVGGMRVKSYYDSLNCDVDYLGLKDHVKFLGTLSPEDLKREIGECSIFVLPSIEESQGIVLLEAMAASKPVVASNVGGIPYIVDDGVNGCLVEYGDILTLSREIIDFVKDKEKRNTFGKNGRKKAEQFLNKNIALKYYKLYIQAYNGIQ